jgi:glutamyl-Q tRNA(Asp) synthetase
LEDRDIETKPYTGRFAPSPTGPLHAGSVVAALASWLDARAAGGRWLVRLEDVDAPRCSAAAAQTILRQLADLGLIADEPPVWQSSRSALYQAAADQLLRSGDAYPCGCTRASISRTLAERGIAHQREAEQVYPGTCRQGLNGQPARALRLRACDAEVGDINIEWDDLRLCAQVQNVTQAVGDFVIHRADGLWAYQLAVVVDDAALGVTHVVRGEDLADNTPRQILLQQRLGLPRPVYLHTPLVLGEDGHKLSKQNGALAAPTASKTEAVATLAQAGAVLGLRVAATTHTEWLAEAVRQWPTMSRFIVGSQDKKD